MKPTHPTRQKKLSQRLWVRSISGLVLMLLFLAWLFGTNSGLKTIFWLAKISLPGHLSAHRIEGRFAGTFSISDLSYQQPSEGTHSDPAFSLKSQHIVVKNQLSDLLRNRFTMKHFSMASSQIITGTLKHPISIQQLSGQLAFKFPFSIQVLNIDTLEGSYDQQPIQGKIDFAYQNNKIVQCLALIKVGTQEFTIRPQESTLREEFLWQFSNTDHTKNRANEALNVEAQGVFTFRDNLNTLQGKWLKGSIQSSFFEALSLKEPVSFFMTKDQIHCSPIHLQTNHQGQMMFQVHWDRLKGAKIMAKVPHFKINTPTLNTRLSLDLDFIQPINQPLQGQAELIIHPGQALLTLPGHKFYDSRFQGGRLKAMTKSGDLLLDLDLKETARNTLQGKVSFPNVSLFSNLKTQKMVGTLSLQAQDLSIAYLLAPQISRLKALLGVHATVQGTLSEPKIDLIAKLSEAIFSVPKQRITVKEFNIDVKGNPMGELSLKSSGTLGGQPFLVQGTWDLNTSKQNSSSISNSNNSFEITGENLKIFNTPSIFLRASPQLKLVFKDQEVFVTGIVKIPEANIAMKEELTSINRSSDVIFVGHEPKEDLIEALTIIPNIEIHIEDEDKVQFKGFGLDAIVRGQLTIARRPDGLFTSEGRLTIKKGKYRLQGSPYYIHRGHLLYPAGTLLNDPILDIRIAQKPDTIAESNEVGIYVQGTLQNPAFHLYSSNPMENNDIISRLGIGGKQSEGKDSRLLTLLTANPLVEKFQNKLGLEEFGIQSGESQRIVSNLGGYDSVLVVGKSLSKRIYLQYVQGLVEPVSLLRLKYFLNPNLAIGVETSTREDVGGDLSFTTEN